LNAVVEVNENQIELFLNKILKHFDNNITGKNFASLGSGI